MGQLSLHHAVTIPCSWQNLLAELPPSHNTQPNKHKLSADDATMFIRALAAAAYIATTTRSATSPLTSPSTFLLQQFVQYWLFLMKEVISTYRQVF
jgi:hypothetical protein